MIYPYPKLMTAHVIEQQHIKESLVLIYVIHLDNNVLLEYIDKVSCMCKVGRS